ncbi:ABC-type multidrug transport system, permease component [Candidatus Nitrososphaera evergladensis SR1]|jgi:ABC-2 type transport system permease protein|uniref:ABC-type multidrug transport system, permease component n=1 Tax=Candidatus Nitrososphaera evergladensis SR1 TaxID=1459636 RepID=A0A075MLX5_9ARCH|nr:ABC transporter permease [Candidatus Nitrososphaera evergladensis]AIF82238.1 ABC-type multidrug transport system, permease component [Candidatus Nitrososphaera evergladensis SR1]
MMMNRNKNNSNNSNSVERFLYSSMTVAEMEARKLRHDSTELWTRVVQPALWLLIFGVTFNSLRALQTAGDFSYIQFITPGILAQSVLFIAIFYGITVVWERDVGIFTRLLSTPSPRASIVLGKALAAGLRGLFQAAMIFVLALLIGVEIRLDPVDVIGVFAIVVLFAMCFSSLSMLLASYMKTRDRMMGIGQALTMPLFFASNAIYPIALMPVWLQYVSLANPLSYVVDALRAMLITGNYANLPVDIAVVLFATVAFVALASVSIKRLLE